MGALDHNPACAPGSTVLVLGNNYVCMMETLRRTVWQGKGRTSALTSSFTNMGTAFPQTVLIARGAKKGGILHFWGSVKAVCLTNSSWTLLAGVASALPALEPHSLFTHSSHFPSTDHKHALFFLATKDI